MSDDSRDATVTSPGLRRRKAPPAKAPDPWLGRVLDERYRIDAFIGAGGMGRVYRGVQLSVDRPVAIKLVAPHLASDRTTVRRFVREARVLSRVHHPNCVLLFDTGETEDGQLYQVMELLEGRGLDAVLKEEGRLAPERAVAIALGVCDALAAAHELDIIHRDVKPSNVFLAEAGRRGTTVKLLDFGLGRTLELGDESDVVTTGAGFCGTPAYLAPEIIQEGDPDPRSDLYALGITLYEMLCGRRPFEGATLLPLLMSQVQEEPPPMDGDVPRPLQAVVLRLLDKEPERRFPSAEHTKEALVAAREVQSAPALGLTSSEWFDASPRRRWPWVAAVVIAVAATGAWSLWPEEATSPVEPTPVARAMEPPPRRVSARPWAPSPRRSGEEAPATVTWELAAEPQAAVSIGGKAVGDTPLTWEAPYGEDEVEIVFARSGYRSEALTVPANESATIEVELSRVSRRRASPPAEEPEEGAEAPPERFILPP